MVHLNVQEKPSRYLFHQGYVVATTPAPNPGANTIIFDVPTANTLKYNTLSRKMNNLAQDACSTDDAYVVVSNMVDKAISTNQCSLKGKL
jgi:hypothetical protein